ncbi:DivIVA domain-containing protein [Alkaliphilus peptidifermentans]|uniref:Cell division initiation protein n=1 Tax=Alkaliphilus peptidifermentans DSM 18978 TaxID=1120976 RepID=A0A1G5B9W4_9FIRM|nr:DivIVA domain-containing protein [Alkaliphilus peptidifermentans]SCX86985.1 cell division initiation protein [Alkaliphilus peptidifermentans DSM 18978]
MLTPLDIQNKEFKKGLRGYKEDEVDEFLDQLMIDYEKLYKENSELKENVEKVSQKIEQYKTIEETLKNTLVVAQNAAEDLRANALKKSELIIQEAENRAKEIIANAHKETAEINGQYNEVKKQMHIFKTRYKTLLQAQLDAVLNDCEYIDNDE